MWLPLTKVLLAFSVRLVSPSEDKLDMKDGMYCDSQASMILSQLRSRKHAESCFESTIDCNYSFQLNVLIELDDRVVLFELSVSSLQMWSEIVFKSD